MITRYYYFKVYCSYFLFFWLDLVVCDSIFAALPAANMYPAAFWLNKCDDIFGAVS